jgi:hypothetical protein
VIAGRIRVRRIARGERQRLHAAGRREAGEPVQFEEAAGHALLADHLVGVHGRNEDGEQQSGKQDLRKSHELNLQLRVAGTRSRGRRRVARTA